MHTARTLPAPSPIRFAHFEDDAAVMFVLVERALKKENNTYAMKMRGVALKMVFHYF